MDASAWIALGSLAAAGFIQCAVFAFFLGGMSQKVKTLQEGASGSTDCKAELAVLNAKFEALVKTMEDVASDVKGLIIGRGERRRSSAND